MSTFPVIFDATRLFYRFFLVPGVTPTWIDSRKLQTLSLAPGKYSFQVQSGIFADFTFVVTAEGTVDYDPSCNGFLGGRGTSSLQLNGFEVTLDASSLSGAAHGGGILLEVPLTNDDWIQRRTIRLLPELGYLVQQGSGVVCNLVFALRRDGTFSYAPELDVSKGGPLQGQGTNSLTFKGHTVRVDATAVSKFLLAYQIWGQPSSKDGKLEVVVLPADHFFLQLDRGVTDLGFSVGITGEVILNPGMTDLLEVVSGATGRPPTVRVLFHLAFQSPIYGPTLVKGSFVSKWQELADQGTADGFSVQQRIGIPVGDVQEVAAAGRTLVVQRFEHGLLIDVKGRNAPSVVYGAIVSRYHSLSEFEGLLGAPLSDEDPAPNEGRKSSFEGGVIHWRADTGAHETHGDIFARWLALGGPGGLLGYPISDELPIMRGAAQVGAVSRFEPLPRDGRDPTVGAIYWSPATEAHEMYGPIFTAWQKEFGGPTGLLGFPTGGPSPTPDGVGRVQTFEKGLVVWQPETGAVPITGGIVLNLFSFAVDDDFNVQIDVTSRFGNTPGPANHGRIPSGGQFNSGTENFPPSEILSFPNVTPDLVVSVNQMEAISERTIGEDARKGNVTPVYDVNNIWGLKEVNHSHHNGSFTAVLAMQHTDHLLGVKPFRQEKFWPFRNFDTNKLSWAQYEQTFRDIAEVDKHISIIPPRFHPLEIAVYEAVYNSIAEGGNCFGMVTEAMYALEKRSLFEEAIFSSGSYRKDGADLVEKGQAPSSENAEVANAINVKMGYQIGSDLIGWFLGKWTAGALHDPVRAFRESRDAFARGDWPLLTVSDKDKFSQDGHAVMPYAWDPSTEAQIGAQPLSGQTWTIFVANPNASAAGASKLPDTDDQCKITIDPFNQNWRMMVRTSDGFWTGSNEEGGRLLTIPYSLDPGQNPTRRGGVC